MSIKKRIEAMSEADVKAALESMIETFALMRHTFRDDNMTLEEVEDHYLDMALWGIEYGQEQDS